MDAALEPPGMGLWRVRKNSYPFHVQLLNNLACDNHFLRTVCNMDAALEPPGMGLWRVRKNSYPFHVQLLNNLACHVQLLNNLACDNH